MMLEIPLGEIAVSRSATQQARRAAFADGELDELVASIREHGVLQPIIVRQLVERPEYHLVAGERRYLASLQAGRATIPAVVRKLTDEQALEVQLIENLQRKDLHPMQEAEGYQELMQVHGHPIEELHARVGKSRSYVYGRLKLLALCKAAREAFHAERINASVALLIARIPSDKLQQQALRELIVEPGETAVSAREGARLVQERFMLRLSGKMFPKDHPQVNGEAGACGSCPKRTGNQAELFGDVASTDVCTDPPCFQAKTKRWGKLRMAEAKAAGQAVVAGKAAKRIWPYEHHLQGYSLLGAKCYRDSKSRTVRAIVGKEAEITLLEDPRSGRVVEAVKDSILDAALRAGRKDTAQNTYQKQQRDQARKRKAEVAFRKALLAELRPKLPPPSARLIAEQIRGRLENDVQKAICKLRGIEVPVNKRCGYRDHRGALEKHLAELPDAELPGFVNDCCYAGELVVFNWSSDKPKRLLAAAEALGVDVAPIRQATAPKPPKKKKAKAKKKARKKAKA
jgi:ParB/RepB/Spo0J family partition protein